MAWQRVDTAAAPRRAPKVGAQRRGSVRWQRRRLFAWLAAASLLTHGWLPIVLQASLAGPGDARHAHHDHLTRAPALVAPDLRRSGRGQECPIFHDPICLCAVFVSFLLPASAPVPAPGVVQGARRRWAKPRRRRPRPVVLIKARAPPRLP